MLLEDDTGLQEAVVIGSTTAQVRRCCESGSGRLTSQDSRCDTCDEDCGGRDCRTARGGGVAVIYPALAAKRGAPRVRARRASLREGCRIEAIRQGGFLGFMRAHAPHYDSLTLSRQRPRGCDFRVQSTLRRSQGVGSGAGGGFRHSGMCKRKGDRGAGLLFGCLAKG
ncbi:MAG: hypothetical protein IJR87_06370 [Bacteroidaceae bacterium]|nr:hypothetical protein [Bacteroidaceae bacterium]